MSGALLWHRRFEARVVASVLVLVALSIAAILVATTRVVTARSLDRTGADLDAARTAFYRLTEERADFASAQSALVTALPVFRAHLTDVRLLEDVETVRALADHYRQQLKASFAIVGDARGGWIAASGWTSIGPPPAELAAFIGQATSGQAARGTIAAADRLFLVVSEPAEFADEVLGTLTVGYALDDDLAKSLAEVTHREINLVADGRLYASSLHEPARAAFAVAITDGRWPRDTDAGTVKAFGDGRYAFAAFPMTLRGDSLPGSRLIILEDWAPTEAFLAQLRWSLLGTGLVIFVAALGMALFFSRRIGRPLEDLAAAAQDIAGGNWTRQLPVRGTAEEVAMSEAVNAMTTSLRHWYEEAKARDDQLRQAQKLEALGRLAGGVAHDFNNFLTAIKGYADLLLEGGETREPQRSKVEGILKAADTAAGLTRQLLAFSRKRVVAVRPVSMPRVLKDTERMLRRVIGENVELSTQAAPGVGCVRADPNQIEQVLLNLVVNARDAVSGSGTIMVDLSEVELREPSLVASPTLNPGRYVRLSVRDNGCGMTPEVQARIFEPFFTTKQEGAGTGLGLAMVYGIVEQLGGGVIVTSEAGRGSMFEIYLPHTTDVEPEATATPAGPAAGGSETVLLVEDEPQLATLIARVLRKSGYTVLQAGHAIEAMGIIRSHSSPIHLLLTDVVMPGMNGRELAERVKQERPDIRVLYMSGYSDDAVLRHGVEAAIAHFLPKPFSMLTLTTKVREVLTPDKASAA